MNKVLVAGLVVAVGAAGYVGGVAVTAGKVDEAFAAQMDQLSVAYTGQAEVNYKGTSGMFSSDYQVSVKILDLPEDLVAEIGTSELLLDVNFKHGFLNSTSTSKLADTQLRTDLKEIQANNAEEFLTAETRYSYDMGSEQVLVDGDFRLAALGYAEAGESFSLAASSGTYSLKGDTFDISMDVGELKLDANEGNMALSGVSLTESGTLYADDPMMTTAFDLLISADTFSFKDAERSMDVKGFNVTADQKTEGDRTLIGVGYGASEIQIQGPDIEEQVSFTPNMHMVFDVDFDAFYGLAKQVGELQRTNPAQLEDPFVMMGMLGGLTGKGLGLEIDDLSIGLKGSKVSATADLDMQPFTMEEAMMQQQALLQKVDLDAQLVIPTELLDAISAIDPEFDASMLEIAVLQGMLVQDEQGYRGELTVKDGQVVLNGTPLPL
ncbi:DUF945 family protein [Aliamphritea spongicola]|uniref:DUF945 family protein n=1 Tax=Aliamphritea spongicola TaxID=707589 RepID=UPI00196ADAD9|nr:DUF945 family protein [Aliamphritea spongicola]MBN3563833.1 DUF945 family protein [Aliamphritea spongicola]